MCRERVDHCLGQIPDLVVLTGILCDRVDKSNAEKGSFGVVVNCGGEWIVLIGGEDMSGGHDILQRLGNDANGVRELSVGDEKESSGGWLHNPFSEAMVYVVALLKEVLCDCNASVGEDGSGRGLGEHVGVVRVERE